MQWWFREGKETTSRRHLGRNWISPGSLKSEEREERCIRDTGMGKQRADSESVKVAWCWWTICPCECLAHCQSISSNFLLLFSHSVVSDSFVTPWTVTHQAPLSWDFPGKNTRVGCHFLLQRIFPTSGSNPRLLHWQEDSLPLGFPGGSVDKGSICNAGDPGVDNTVDCLGVLREKRSL